MEIYSDGYLGVKVRVGLVKEFEVGFD